MILSDDQTDASLTIGECYYVSEQIAGNPEDRTLSYKTAEAISNGQQLLDYSDEDNKYTYQAYFSAYEMNPAVTEESYFASRYLNKEEDVEFILYSTFPP